MNKNSTIKKIYDDFEKEISVLKTEQNKIINRLLKALAKKKDEQAIAEIRKQIDN